MLEFKQGVVTIRIDRDTIIVDTTSGQYFAANTIAYEMITTLLKAKSNDEAVATLTGIIAADEQTLRQDLQDVRARLSDLHLVV